MSYTIRYSDPAKNSYPIIVQDTTIFNGVGTGGLTLVGRNYPGYGEFVAGNFIKILENSASTVPPINPVEGQLWYDSSTRKLRINDGAASNANWKPINGLFQQAFEPTNVVTGDLWVDTVRNQVFLYSNNQWITVGPETATEGGLAGPRVETILDKDGNEKQVTAIYVRDEVIAVISGESFQTAAYDNISIIKKGITIPSTANFEGTAYSAEFLRQSGGTLVSANSVLRKDISQTITGQFSIAQDANALQIGTDRTFILERSTSGVNANFVNSFDSYGSFTFNTKNENGANIQVMSVGNNPSQVRIIPATPSSSTSTGALVVAGGVGIGGDLYLNGSLTFSSVVSTLTVASLVLTGTTDSASTATGTLTVKGGIGIGGNIYLGGDLFVPRKLVANGIAGTSGQVLVSNEDGTVRWAPPNSSNFSGGSTQTVIGFIATSAIENSTSTSGTSGALRVAGGASIGKDLWLGGGMTATQLVINSTVITTSSIATGVAVAISNTASTALSVAGGATIGGNLSVAGEIVAQKLTIEYTTITTTLITSDDEVVITSSTNATSTVTGAFRVAGGVGIGKDLYVGGNVYSTGGAPLVNFNTATLVSQALYASTSSIAEFATSFNTSTLVTTATTARFISTPATAVQLGGVRIGANIGVDVNGVISVATPYVLTTATSVALGGVRLGNSSILSFGNGTIYVNTATLMANAVTSQFITTPATTSSLGGVKIGPSIAIDSSGTINVNILPATTATLGGVKQISEEPSIVIFEDGTIGLNVDFLTTGSGLSFTIEWNTSTSGYEVIYGLNTASVTTLGGVKIGTGIGIAPDGTISVTTASFDLQTATTDTLGGVRIGSGISIDGSGIISVNTGTPYVLNTATAVALGGVRIGSGISIDGSGIISVNTGTPFTLTTATAVALGGVKVGSNIDVAGDGTISVTFPAEYSLTTATAVALGGVKVGSNINVAGDGTISVATPYVLNTATAVTLGGVKVGSNINVAGDGTISVATPYVLNTATAVVLGGVKVGSNINVAGDGTISVAAPYTLPAADGTTLGGVIVGNGLTSEIDGTISLNTATVMATAVTATFAVTATTAQFVSTTATTTQLGGIRIGDGLEATGAGVVSVNTASFAYTLPPATGSVLGGVKIGANINVAGDGTISITPGAYTLNSATTFTLGGVKIGTGVQIAGDGTISVNTGTPYSLPIASTSSLGGVKIGANISLDGDGTISVAPTPPAYVLPVATTSTLGGVRENPETPGIVINEFGGDLNLNIAFTASQGLYYNYGWSTTATQFLLEYGLSTATTTLLGGVKIGTGLSVSSTGTVSLNTATLVQTATTLAAGTTLSGGISIAGVTTVTNVTQASSTSTGALQVRGGAAVGGDIWLGGNLLVSTGTIRINGAQAINGPAWAVLPTGAAQSIAPGSVKLLFQTKEFDTATAYNTTTNRLVPGVLGYYQMNAAFSSVSTLGTGTIFMSIYRNGVEYRRGDRIQTFPGPEAVGCTISTQVITTTTNDYFEVYVNNSTGGTITGEVGNGIYGPWFNGSFVRGV
jgi:hypothetical protein